MTEQVKHPVTPQQRFALIACIFLAVSATGYLQPFVALFQSACGLSARQIGLIGGIAAATALLVQPILGRLSDRWDARRPMMVLGAAMAGCAYFSYTHAFGFPAFLLLTIAGQNGVGYLNVAAGVLVGRIAAVTQAGRAYAGYRVWGSIGYIIVALASGILLSMGVDPKSHLDRAHLTPIFAWGSLLFVAVMVTAFFVPDRKNVERPAVEQSDDEPVVEAVSAGRVHATSTRNLRMFLLAFFLYSFAMSGMQYYLGLYMKSRGESPLWISGTFAAGVICEVLVMVQIGKLTDLYGRRPALAVAFLVLPLRLLLYIPASTPLWILIVHLLHGFNFGIMGAIAVVFVNDIAADRNRGHAQSRLASAQGLAASIAPMLGGQIADRLGMGWMFATMAAIAAAGAVVFITQVHESHPSPVSLMDRCPVVLRPMLRLLTAPR